MTLDFSVLIMQHRVYHTVTINVLYALYVCVEQMRSLQAHPALT